MTKSKRKRSSTGRDYNMVSIIKGANKAYVEKDQKKEANKKAARTKVKEDEERCLQCGFPYTKHPGKDKDERAAQECGYCSVSCMDYWKGRRGHHMRLFGWDFGWSRNFAIGFIWTAPNNPSLPTPNTRAVGFLFLGLMVSKNFRVIPKGEK